MNSDLKNKPELTEEDLDVEVVKKIEYKETCCESYLTPKGRCYNCPGQMIDSDPDEDDY